MKVLLLLLLLLLGLGMAVHGGRSVQHKGMKIKMKAMQYLSQDENLKKLQEGYRCVPRSRWRNNCAICRCLDWNEVQCFSFDCPEPGSSPDRLSCKLGSMWREWCQVCRCIRGHASCSDIPNCPVKNKTDQVKCSGKPKDGKWRKDACNWCNCVGGKSNCTKNACQDSCAPDGIDLCQGNVTWDWDCKTCSCIGGFTFCKHQRDCKPSIPWEDQCLGMPQEGKWQKDACNWCYCCNRKRVCTTKACPEGDSAMPESCKGSGFIWTRNKGKDRYSCYCDDGEADCILEKGSR